MLYHKTTCCECGGVLCLLWWVILSNALCLFLSRRDFSFFRRFFRSWMMKRYKRIKAQGKRVGKWEVGIALSSDLRQLLPHAHIEVVCQQTIIFKHTFPVRCTGGPSDSELLLPASLDSRSDSMAMSSGSTPGGTSRPSAASFATTDCRYSFSSSQRMCSTCEGKGGGGVGRRGSRGRGRRGRRGRWDSQMAQDRGLHVILYE